jgi:Tol biopolymer transport system component
MFTSVVPANNGKKLFVQASQPRGRLIRRDLQSGQFVPYLDGISATDLAFSPDGRWVAYVTIPEGNLWRSRVDGSERLQLTYPPVRALLPVWSPDGKRILYNSLSAGASWNAQSISSEGGMPEDLFPEGRQGVDFNWSPDGRQIIFSSGPAFPPFNIQVLDLASHQISTFPGSEGLFSPRRSPDGRYLAALSRDSSIIMLYDFHEQRWSKWLTEPRSIAFPSWSRDSRYVYFDDFLTDHPSARRVGLGRTQSEELYGLAGLHRFQSKWSGTWGGLAPDDSRLYVQDAGTQEIYALDVTLP